MGFLRGKRGVKTPAHSLNVERQIWLQTSPHAIKIWLNPVFPQRSEIT